MKLTHLKYLLVSEAKLGCSRAEDHILFKIRDNKNAYIEGNQGWKTIPIPDNALYKYKIPEITGCQKFITGIYNSGVC